MGLDMYLYKNANFKSIEWATPREEEKDKYERQVIITATDGTQRLVKAYTVREITTVTNEKIELWEIEKIHTVNGKKHLEVKVWNEDTQGVVIMQIPFSTIVTINYEYAYWRKANQIHRWFVDTVQDGEDDCGYYEVTSEQLMDLTDLCKQVLNKRTTDSADATLPTCAGFFFGGTDYDNYYFEDLENTVKQLAEVKPNEVYTYTSSW